VLRRALPAALFAFLAACDKEEPQQRPVPPAPVASIERVLGVDAGDLEPSVDPPAPAGDFRAEMDTFTTLDACARQRAALDPLVGDALEAIGYDTLVRDACRVLDAAKAHDARRCESIDSSALRERCQAAVAEIAGEPDACPFEVARRPELGRDAACLALAVRDARLCAGAPEAAARTTCIAIATHDAAPCARLPVRGEQARCARDEKRWASAIPAAGAGNGAASGAGGAASGAGGAASIPSGTATVDGRAVPLDVSRGVVLLERIDGVHLAVGPMGHAGSGFVAPSPLAQGSIALELVVPADPKKAAVERLELSLPQRPALTVESPRTAPLSVRVTRVERARGGAVELSVAGAMPDGAQLEAAVSTFVRDVVKASAQLGTTRFGDAGILR
jgi:hypothetical protein